MQPLLYQSAIDARPYHGGVVGIDTARPTRP